MVDIIDRLLEIELREDDDFLKVKETLTRIGVASRKENTLYQSCHILHKQGRFFIVHFKEMFMLDGRPTDFTDEDLGRRNTIAALLAEWGLITIVNPDVVDSQRAPMSQIKIIPHRDKANWTLVPKYAIGKKAQPR